MAPNPARSQSFSEHLVVGECADVRPRAPVDCQGGQSFGTAVVGQRVEKGVGCRVVGLPRISDQAGSGGEQDEHVQVGGLRTGERVEQKGALGLRDHDLAEALFVLLFHHCVVEHSCCMDDAAQGAAAEGLVLEESGDVLWLGDVGFGDRHLDTGPFQGGDLRPGALTRAAPTDEHQGAGTSRGHPVGHEKPQAAQPASDPVGALGVQEHGASTCGLGASQAPHPALPRAKCHAVLARTGGEFGHQHRSISDAGNRSVTSRLSCRLWRRACLGEAHPLEARFQVNAGGMQVRVFQTDYPGQRPDRCLDQSIGAVSAEDALGAAGDDPQPSRSGAANQAVCDVEEWGAHLPDRLGDGIGTRVLGPGARGGGEENDPVHLVDHVIRRRTGSGGHCDVDGSGRA